MADRGHGRGAPVESDVRASVEPLEQRKLMSADAAGEVVAPAGPPTGVLLPAVQKVREAAARLGAIADTHALPGPSPVGSLLPAVQKVREAAARLPGDDVPA